MMVVWQVSSICCAGIVLMGSDINREGASWRFVVGLGAAVVCLREMIDEAGIIM